ncbi:hypothetical protein D3C86_966130 [compost metagenome]
MTALDAGATNVGRAAERVIEYKLNVCVRPTATKEEKVTFTLSKATPGANGIGTGTPVFSKPNRSKFSKLFKFVS